MLRALLLALRRLFSRWAARRLLGQRLPRGLREQRLALPAPVRAPPPGEFWTVGRRPARLFRLSALPPPAGLAVFEPRRFRLDPATHAPSHEGVLPLARRDPSYGWVGAEFRRRFIDLPWMARNRLALAGPTAAERFAIWWERAIERGPGAREPRQWERPDEVDWAMDECKEQMLIRRDVVKDEQGPPPAEMSAPTLGHPLVSWDPAPLPQLVPAKEWVEVADPRALLPPPPDGRAPREAYLRWRTLLDALGD